MSVRIAMIEALRTAHGFDPEYDDGVDADTVLSVLHAAGFAVVPVEPTEAMIHAGGCAMEVGIRMEGPKPGSKLRAGTVYRAMIATVKEAGV